MREVECQGCGKAMWDPDPTDTAPGLCADCQAKASWRVIQARFMGIVLQHVAAETPHEALSRQASALADEIERLLP